MRYTSDELWNRLDSSKDNQGHSKFSLNLNKGDTAPVLSTTTSSTSSGSSSSGTSFMEKGQIEGPAQVTYEKTSDGMINLSVTDTQQQQ